VSLLSKAFVLVIRVYQRIVSPLLGARCRFYPTCSAYMIEAVERDGVIVGVVKGVWRVLRCNPLNPGGYDPVDPAQKAADVSEPLRTESLHDRTEEC